MSQHAELWREFLHVAVQAGSINPAAYADDLLKAFLERFEMCTDEDSFGQWFPKKKD